MSKLEEDNKNIFGNQHRKNMDETSAIRNSSSFGFQTPWKKDFSR